MKASPAFGRRRLHTKTDCVDCPALFCFFFSSFFFFLFFFMLTFKMVREAKQNWPKSKLAEVEIGRSRNWPKSKLGEVEIGRSRTGRTRKKKLAEVKIGRSRPRPPKFRVFFSLSRRKICSFLPSLLVEFWWCLKHRGAQMCTFRLSGCRVKPRRPGLVGPPERNFG